MKHCFKCGIRKPIGEFYRHPKMADKHAGKCKECTKADVHKNRLAKIDYYRSYDRLRASRPHRLVLAKKIQERWKRRFPERRKAHVLLGNAVRDGKVVPWPVCAMPECDGKPEAHHPDYSRPLDVVWLCPAHHKQAHAMLRKAA